MEILKETIVLSTKNGKLISEERVPEDYILESCDELWRYWDFLEEYDLTDEFDDYYSDNCSCWDDVIPMDILSLATQSDIIWDFIEKEGLVDEYNKWEKDQTGQP